MTDVQVSAEFSFPRTERPNLQCAVEWQWRARRPELLDSAAEQLLEPRLRNVHLKPSRTHDANPSGEDRRRVVDRPQELNQIGAIRCVRYKVMPHTSVTIL